MKIAFIGSLDPSSVFPEELILSRYRKYAHPAPWIGGLLPNLARLGGFDLRVFVIHRAIAKACEVEKNGVIYEGVPSPMLERFAVHSFFHSKSLAAAPAIKRFKPDLIHAFGMETGSATIALRHGVPVSCFIQGIAERLLPYYGNRSFIHKHVAARCERSAVRKIRWMIAETEFARDWALSHHPDACIEVIPHPLRPEFLKIPHQPESGRVLTIGGLDDRKGMDTIIRAFARIKMPDARLCMVGGGICADELRALAGQLGVADRVDFTGSAQTDRVMAELARASVFVIGSRMDTSPNVVTEAHAAGLPVVGTRAGGIPEMIDDGVDGYHVDIDDDSAMAGRLSQLLNQPDDSKRMGLAGKEKVRELNCPERIAKAQHRFFKTIQQDLTP